MGIIIFESNLTFFGSIYNLQFLFFFLTCHVTFKVKLDSKIDNKAK